MSFAAAFLSALLLTPLVRDIARRAGLVDASDGDRKLHPNPVPRLGGIAIVASLALALGILVLDPAWRQMSGHLPFLTILLGGLAMHVLGVVDDIHALRARHKLLVQVIVALAVWFAGVRVELVSIPGMSPMMLPAVVSALVTAMWLVGVTNAFNLIDGVDGLAAGAALVALLTMTAIGVVNGQWAATWVTLSLAGATLGLLVYNFPPASIFLGDAGSLFLGFMLAGSGLLSTQKSSTAVAVAVPLLVLGLPVLDTSLAIVRRFLRGQAIFVPDRGHIHHRLLNRGFSARGVTLQLYLVCAVLGLAGFALLTRPEFQVVLLVLIGLAGGLFVHQLHIHEFEELAGGMIRGTFGRQVIRRTVMIREMGARLTEQNDLDALLDATARALDASGLERAEVLLRRHFLERGAGIHRTEESTPAEVRVWTWGETGLPETAWEMTLPLLGARGDRIGSLRVQQRAAAADAALTNWFALGVHVAAQLGPRVEELWPLSVTGMLAVHHERRPLRPRRISAATAAVRSSSSPPA